MLPPEWWRVLYNAVPVYCFAPDMRAKAEHYVTDSAYRLESGDSFHP
jgi:hypothetical protein